jgi:hypothetical protein
VKKKLLTLEDLIKFCREQKLFSFNAKDKGYPICVHVPATFKKDEEENSSLLYATVKSFHTGENRNGSSVTKEAAKKSMSSFAYKPILAAFTTDKNGDEDFMSHEMELDEDGNVVYIEHQVGCFTVDKPWMEKDPDVEGREYIFAKCAIPREYTSAASIIERKGGTKVSVELIVNSFSYDEEQDVLLLEDIEVSGLTLLGVKEEGADPKTDSVEEGMEGARLDIADFSTKKNSSFNMEELQGVIKEAVLQAFSDINNSKEGGKKMKFSEEKLNELLEKYAVKSEDLTFDLEAIESDEALEKAFEAQFSNPSPEPTATEENMIKMSLTLGETVKEFSRSLSEVIYALTDLVNATYSDDNTMYAVDVYDDGSAKSKYLIMQDFFTGKAYRQGWSLKDGIYSLKGERTEVFSVWVTAEEREQLESLKANYEAKVKEFEEASKELSLYKEEPDKLELLNSPDYSSIKKSAEFEELSKRENYFSLSKEELEGKLDGILLTYSKQKGKEQSDDDEPDIGIKMFGTKKETKGQGRYGSMFVKD